MDPQVQAAIIGGIVGALVGGLLGILGAVPGGWVQGRAWYHYEQRRAAAEEKKRWVKLALEWASTGRCDSLRRANLEGADGVSVLW